MFLWGGRGDDTLDGGGGNDMLKGGLGDDRLIFDLSDAGDSLSRYNGGNGSDTLQIKASREQFLSLREDLVTLKSWMSEQSDATNSGGSWFETSFGLAVRNLEVLEVYVDGYGLVDPANTPPSAVSDEVSIAEDEAATVDVLANDHDIEGDALEIVHVGDALDAGGNVVGETSIAGGQVIFTPLENWSGTATIEYVIDDGNGLGPEGYGIDAQHSTLVVTVNPVNDAPVANPDQGEQTSDEIKLYDVLENDTDIDEGDSPENFQFIQADSLSGEVEIVDNQIRFDPSAQFDHLAAGDTEEVVINYVMSDMNGEQSSSTLTLTVTGTGSSIEVGDDQALAVAEDSGDTALGIPAPETTSGTALDITVLGLPEDGFGGVFKSDGTPLLAGDTLTPEDLANLVFRAADDAFGEAGQFSYSVSDGQSLETRTVDIEITPINDAPQLSVPDYAPAFGDEFQVNSTTFSDQMASSIATLDDGSYVVVWTSRGQDGSGWGIYGQRYDAVGGTIGGEFQVNSFKQSNQVSPSVATTSDGGFVVTWSSFGQDGDSWGVFGQRFDSVGNAIDGMFQANTFSAYGQQFSTVTALENGDFVVTWTSSIQDRSFTGIFGQRFQSDGTALGSEFRINTTTRNFQELSAVAATKDGGFVITWQSYTQDGDSWGIFGQRFDADGGKAGSEFRVNTYASLSQEASQVTGLSDGGFIVVWASDGQDGDGFGIFSRRYDAAGVAQGGEVQVNSFNAWDQSEPAVTALSDGGYVVVWQSEGQDGSSGGIFGQRFNADGNAVEDEFQVNVHTDSLQRSPDVSALHDGG